MPQAAKRLRQMLTTPVMTPTSRAIFREAKPSAASSTIARLTMRCSLLDARTQPSSVLRVSGSSRISVALGIMDILNHAAIPWHRGARQLLTTRGQTDSGFNAYGY
jgi:hypothetical protein